MKLKMTFYFVLVQLNDMWIVRKMLQKKGAEKRTQNGLKPLRTITFFDNLNNSTNATLASTRFFICVMKAHFERA